MGTRGPRPKTAQELKLRGTFRKDRHAAREAAAGPAGVPEKPKTLTGEAAAEWDRIVPELVRLGLVGSIDQSLIVGACRFWAHHCAYDKLQEKDPANIAAGRESRANHTQYLQCVAQLGLSPLGRSRVKATPVTTEAPKPKLAKFARQRA